MSDDVGKSARDRMLHTAQVKAIVGARVFADVLDQNATLPAIVAFVKASDPHQDLNGPDRCGPATIEVFAYGTDRAQANALAKAIRTYALAADLQGSIEGMDWRECSLISGPSEVVDQPIAGSDAWRKITQQTFSIWANAL